MRGSRKRSKEVFFFEKKKQKTFNNFDFAQRPAAWGWITEPYY